MRPCEVGEVFAADFHDFLLHADGWEGVYYDLDLFGSRELRGGGCWRIAEELLDIYTEEGVMEALQRDPKVVMPVAAGDGTDLVPLIRSGWDGAGESCGSFAARSTFEPKTISPSSNFS